MRIFIVAPFVGIIVHAHAVVTFEWRGEFSEKSKMIVSQLEALDSPVELPYFKETQLLAGYLKEAKNNLDAITASETRPSFCEKIKSYQHRFIRSSFKDKELFEALIAHEQEVCAKSEECEWLSPYVTLVIIKACEQKRCEFLEYLDAHITNFPYLSFEAGLLLKDEELQQGSFEKGISFEEPFYRDNGSNLELLVYGKRSGYMIERMKKFNKKKNKKRGGFS